MKHTPGPWTIGGELISKQGTAIEIASVWRNTHPDRSADAPDPDTADANARLIAAAPELLEALELVSKWFQDYGSAPLHGSALLTDSDEPISEVLRAAIAKATT